MIAVLLRVTLLPSAFMFQLFIAAGVAGGIITNPANLYDRFGDFSQSSFVIFWADLIRSRWCNINHLIPTCKGYPVPDSLWNCTTYFALKWQSQPFMIFGFTPLAILILGTAAAQSGSNIALPDHLAVARVIVSCSGFVCSAMMLHSKRPSVTQHGCDSSSAAVERVSERKILDYCKVLSPNTFSSQFVFRQLNQHANLLIGFICLAASVMGTAAQSGGSIALSNYVVADDAAVKLNWPDSSTWVNSGQTQPTCNGDDGSCIFDGTGQYLDAGTRDFSIQANGFTATARVLFHKETFDLYQRICEFFSPNNGVRADSVGISVNSRPPYSMYMFIIGNNYEYFPECDNLFTNPSLFMKTNTWYMLTAVFYAPSKTMKFYINGILECTKQDVSFTRQVVRVSSTYIGRGFASNGFLNGRMKFFAAYDRALTEAEILNQHKTQAPINAEPNVTLTLSFSLPSGASFKIVSVTGLRFSSFRGAAASIATCSNLGVSGVVVSPSFPPPDGPLVLSLSELSASAVASADIICRVFGFSNVANPSATDSSTTIAVFGAGGLHVITHRNVTFPAIFSAFGSGASISLSSYHAGASNVTISISFIVATNLVHFSFKTISVAGLRFSAFNSINSLPKCTNINASNIAVTASMTLPSGILLLRFSNGVNVARGPLLSAFEPGFSGVPKYFTTVGSPQISNTLQWRGYNAMFFNNPTSINSMSANYFAAPLFVGQQMTVTAWILADYSHYSYQTALGFAKKGAPEFCFQLDFDSNKVASVHMPYSDGRWDAQIYIPNAMLSDQFVHVAFSRALNFETKLYFNGVLKHTSMGSRALPACDSLYIGGSGFFDRGFHGHLQDLRVYDRVLSREEVISLAAMTPISPNEVTCSVSGLTNTGISAATMTTSVSTFNADDLPLQTQIGVEFPALYQSPPATSGLIAHYNADSWTGARWTDLSGAGNHVTDIGGTTKISVARPVGAPSYIYGAPTAWMRFPAGILPSVDYSLFFVARYNGAARGRIFQGVDTNWLSGFEGSMTGVAHHGSCSWIKDRSGGDLHGYGWVTGTDRSNSFRSNGVDRTMNAAPCPAFDRLAINKGWDGNYSDFAIQVMLVYNRRLSDSDVMRVEAWLTSLQPAFTPANLQARITVDFIVKHFCHHSDNLHITLPILTITHRA